ncbi:hypothetical protein [Oricola cellulosilytica]|uniref:Uncharacterized protein n=1 Tax=Oricola cellulosilytica TaxID=1429082 RepID=A0A4V2MNX4_9HYPH|nr:hypothetical protein [Oricola cellulosilytica]TCD15097.1 hypothetical protein E0D97_05990 [Oricola cellulosilytica]
MARPHDDKTTETKDTDLQRADLASREMGDNDLQGDDQANVRNQRHAVPDVKTEADDVIESFEKMDKDVRAKEDLGKGNRSSSDED